MTTLTFDWNLAGKTLHFFKTKHHLCSTLRCWEVMILWTYPCCLMLQFLPASILKNGATCCGGRPTSRGRSRLWSHSDTSASPVDGSERLARSNTTCKKADLTANGKSLSWPCRERKKVFCRTLLKAEVFNIKCSFFHFLGKIKRFYLLQVITSFLVSIQRNVAEVPLTTLYL